MTRETNGANVKKTSTTKRTSASSERLPSGRRKVPLGIRTGGEQWNAIHAQIAASALDLLAEVGYTAFSIEGLAERSGVNKRTIYRHYATKLDLAVTAIRQMPTFTGWADTQGTPKERLRAAVKVGSSYSSYITTVLAACIIHADDEPILLETLQKQVLHPREKAVHAFLAEGKRDGWARKDIATWQVLAYITGLDVSAQAGLKPLSNPKKWVNSVTEALWDMIAAPEMTAK